MSTRKKKFSRKDMSADLDKRAKKSYDTRDDKGVFKDYFDPNKMDGVQKWWAGKGTHVIDIIPYYAGKHDPIVKEGKATYVLDIWTHQRVGAAEESFVCMAQYGERCPICEEKKRRGDNDEDWETRIKPLRPKRRCVYNIIVRDGGQEEAKGIQIFEIAHYFMEANLIKIAKDPDGGMISFWCPTNGKRISFERSGVGATNTSYVGHSLHDRKKKVTDAQLAAAYCLDEMIVLPAYNDVYKSFHGCLPDEGLPENVSQPSANENGDGEAVLLECPLEDGTYGVTFDEFVECDECGLRDSCADEDVPF